MTYIFVFFLLFLPSWRCTYQCYATDFVTSETILWDIHNSIFKSPDHLEKTWLVSKLQTCVISTANNVSYDIVSFMIIAGDCVDKHIGKCCRQSCFEIRTGFDRWDVGENSNSLRGMCGKVSINYNVLTKETNSEYIIAVPAGFRIYISIKTGSFSHKSLHLVGEWYSMYSELNILFHIFHSRHLNYTKYFERIMGKTWLMLDYHEYICTLSNQAKVFFLLSAEYLHNFFRSDEYIINL